MSMSALIQTSISALDVAASLSGIPGLAVATTILQQIADVCNQVSVNKAECKQLADKCAQLLLAYRDQSSRLEGSELLQYLDQVTSVMEKVLGRVRKWAGYSYYMAIMKKSYILHGIGNCQKEVDTALAIFDVHSQAIMHQTQRLLQDQAELNNQQVLETLSRLITGQERMAQILARQNAGENLAEPLMLTGQNELRALRTRFAEQPNLPDPRTTERYTQIEETLVGLHRATGIPPSVKRLDGEITRQDGIPFTGGLYYDVYLGTWLGQEKVALKALRGIRSQDRIKQRFEREIEFWSKLHHPNILPFYGIVTDIGQQIHMVSPWQSEGNLLEYVKKNANANQHALLHGAASGLSYLHSRSIVHGNVKCSNVLISSNGEARICDFGMSKIMEEVTEVSASKTLTSEGSARYVAPELIESNEASTTIRSDVYSFAMLILECISREKPFSNLRRDAAVIHAVVNKRQHPARPVSPMAEQWLSDPLWELMRRCWTTIPANRPTMKQVCSFFEGGD